ncbi:MAG: sialidase family protein [Candidatus Eisenbacteria bacterium]
MILPLIALLLSFFLSAAPATAGSGWFPEELIAHYPTAKAPRADGIAAADTVVLATTIDSAGAPHVLRSADLGETWTDTAFVLQDTMRTSAIAAEENVVVVAFSGPPLLVFSSLDHGLTWQGPVTVHGFGERPSLCSRDGVFYMVFDGPVPVDREGIWALCVRSDDNGASWIPPFGSMIGPADAVEPNVDIAAGPSRLHAVWADGAPPAPEEVHYSHSDNGGNTWSPPAPISELDETDSRFPSVATREEDVHVAWHDYMPGYFVHHRRSVNEGTSWEPLRLVCEGRFADILADTLGLHLICTNCDGLPMGLGVFYRRSPDGGGSWVDSALVAHDQAESTHPHIASGAGGRHAVFEDDRGGGINHLWYARHDPIAVGLAGGGAAAVASGLRMRIGPNPCAAGTSLELLGGAPGRAVVRVFDIRGRLVATLTDDRTAPGARTLHWDGCDRTGERVATGVDLVRAERGGERSSARVSVLR